MERIHRIEFEQHGHGNRYEENREEAFQPVLPLSRQRIEFRVHVMHLVVLPQDIARVEAAMVPIEKEVAEKSAEQKGAGEQEAPFFAAELKVNDAEIQAKEFYQGGREIGGKDSEGNPGCIIRKHDLDV